MTMMEKIIVNKKYDGKKLNKVIMSENLNINYNTINKLLRKKDIKINGKRTNKDIIVYENDIIEIYIPYNPQEVKLDIVYEDEWIEDSFVKEMIQDVDKSTVIDSGVIDSPVLGKIPPIGLSGGVKTLILVKFEPEKVFNVSTCGDNCAKWLLKIAEQEDRTVNLRHLMDFGKKPFTIKVLNTNQIVHSMEELILAAGEFV